MIVRLRGLPDTVLAVLYSGQIVKADDDEVLLPAVRAALERNRKLRVYCEVAPDFSGIDAGAAWEDVKIGLGHLNRRERVAVVTDVKWLEQVTRFFNFLAPASMKTFAPSEAAQARTWVVAAG